MSKTANKVYGLLPAVYRIRDIEKASRMEGLLEDHEQVELQSLQSISPLSKEQEQRLQKLLEKKQSGPLKALISVIAGQVDAVESDIAQLYENWFIETCDEWVIPYIGDLLGVRGLHTVRTEALFSRRSIVANTLSYRRRKGTAAVLEQLAFDTTGWRARAVEFFELLGTTQYSNHIRSRNLRTPNLRDTNKLELLDSAFDSISHTADVRRIAIGRGRHNITNIGLFLWRLQSYPVTRTTARAASNGPAGCYTFSPLGHNMHLFNRPQTEDKITHIAEEINVPGLLRRRPLYDELEERRQLIAEDLPRKYTYFDDSPDSKSDPVIEIFLNGSLTPLSPDEILICNLDDWRIPSDKKKYQKLRIDGTYEYIKLPVKAAIDPVLGRMAFPPSVTLNQEPQVSYAYGFSGDIGGGPYNRHDSVYEALSPRDYWQVGVSKETAPIPGKIYPTLTEAVKEWNRLPDGKSGVITILDSYTYKENLTGSSSIKIPEGRQLMIVAAGWPELDVPGGLSALKDYPAQLTPVNRRPHLLGNLNVKGTAADTSLAGGELILDGLLIEGKLTVLAGNLGNLRLSHSTLAPDQGGLEVNAKNDRLKISLMRTICGPVKLNASVPELLVKESIVDNGNKEAVAASRTSVDIQKCTVFGSVHALKIEAGNCIFTGKVEVVRCQEGCLRFSYVPPDSRTPRQFRCQPDLEIAVQIEEVKKKSSTELSQIAINAITKSVQEWLVPAFTSNEYWRHAYGQLSLNCPELIRTGAEDGSEMGVFSILLQPQRTANLQIGLDEYLRFGLEAGIIYVT